jgi:hypothetical protein
MKDKRQKKKEIDKKEIKTSFIFYVCIYLLYSFILNNKALASVFTSDLCARQTISLSAFSIRS